MGGSVSRRMFVGGAAAIASVRASGAARAGEANAAEQAFQLSVKAAQDERQIPDPDHPTNGDEQLYPNHIANFSKGLPHNSLGEVDTDAYNALLNALRSEETSEFEN